jgi:hypothetical protein
MYIPHLKQVKCGTSSTTEIKKSFAFCKVGAHWLENRIADLGRDRDLSTAQHVKTGYGSYPPPCLVGSEAFFSGGKAISA